MPPRYAYWTILIDNKPTAFRASKQEELQPTLGQLQRTNQDVVMKWFARGKLWDNPEQAQWAGRNVEGRGEKRGRDWRPGGTHVDPRARFDRKKGAAQAAGPKRNRPWNVNARPDQRPRPNTRPEGNAARPSAPDKTFTPEPGSHGRPYGVPPGPRREPPPGERAQGRPYGTSPPSKPFRDRPRGKPVDSRPPGQGHPYASRPKGIGPANRPHGKPPGDRPEGKPSGERPRGKHGGDRPHGKPYTARPQGNPSGDRPHGMPPGDRRWKPKPGGHIPADRPWTQKPRDSRSSDGRWASKPRADRVWERPPIQADARKPKGPGMPPPRPDATDKKQDRKDEE